MSRDQQLVWYALVDKDGNPFKNTTRSIVCLDEGSVVAQLRDAVQLKNDKPGYLKDIPSSTLLVYSSLDALANKDDHLKASSSLDDRGKSKKDALVVVVASYLNKDAYTIHQVLRWHFPELKPAACHTGTATTGSVVTKYPEATALDLREWSSFDKDVADYVQLIEDAPLNERVVYLKPRFQQAESVVIADGDYMVFSPLETLLETMSKHDPTMDAGAFMVTTGNKTTLGDPDRIWSPQVGGIPKLTIEYKSHWALPHQENLVTQYNVDRQVYLDPGEEFARRTSLMRAIDQEYVYMTLNRHRYGVLTTLNQTWFLRKVELAALPNQSILEVSPAISCNSEPPRTLFACWVYLIKKISSGDSDWIYASPYSSRVASPILERSMQVPRSKYNSIKLDKYLRWQQVIARSQSGAVVLAMCTLGIDEKGEEYQVVLKTIDLSKHSDAKERFDHEVSVYKDLETLQGSVIPKFIAYGSYYGMLQVIVLENVGRKISKDEAKKRSSSIQSRVARINGFGYLHGDLRPDNILVDDLDNIRIIDFGLSEKHSRIDSSYEEEILFDN